MKIAIAHVMVDDQKKALHFYTEVLGFIKKRDIPMGEHSWLTVVSPQEPDGTELLLEPMGFEPARVFQKALFDAGIPATMFKVEDIQEEYRRLQGRGVEFKIPPTQMGPSTIATFADGCGNYLQIFQV
ncbi:VOC family protein [Puia sp. P3]|uniref:VOC family protein n=1 Tax=Puia sp. P3 TaxID=3423952 RepID=UPI003D679012